MIVKKDLKNLEQHHPAHVKQSSSNISCGFVRVISSSVIDEGVLGVTVNATHAESLFSADAKLECVNMPAQPKW